MESGLIAVAVTPHTPRMGIEAQAPPFVQGLISGSRALGAAVRSLRPDVVVLQSAHWVTTFNWYITAQAVHEGLCVAEEAPDLIPGLPYRRPGDPRFATILRDVLVEAGLPGGLNETPASRWDYATYVPLHYADPESRVPLVILPSVLCADLPECQRVGALIQSAAVAAGRRVVFLASCALSHQVVRGPEVWPTPARQALDKQLVALLCAGTVPELQEWLPDYCRKAVAEMGGRPLATLLGTLVAMAAAKGPVAGRQLGSYAQSSGSGNATVWIAPSDT